MRAIFQKQMTRRKVEPVKTAENGTQQQRETTLLAIFNGIDEGMLDIIRPLITDVAYLEGELSALRVLPKLRVHPSDPQRQEATPAAKQYKEFLQQYTNCIKVLTGVLHKEAPEEESPLRQFLAARAKQNGA